MPFSNLRLQADVRSLLLTATSQEAFPNGPGVMLLAPPASTSMALRWCTQQGGLLSDAGLGYRLKPGIMNSIIVPVLTLTSGVDVVSVRGDVPLEDASLLELAHLLVKSGWRDQPRAPGPRPPPYVAGGSRTWFVDSKPQRSYMMALVLSDDIFAKGVDAIHHYQSVSYYEALLKSDSQALVGIMPGQPLF